MVRVSLEFAILFGLLRLSGAAWWHGTVVVPANSAVLLAKFCFDFDRDSSADNFVGVAKATLSASDSSGESSLVKVALFDDQAESYPGQGVFQGFQCEAPDMLRAARWIEEKNISDTGPVSASCNVFERLRPRWWYVAIVECSGEDRQIEYSVHMTNPKLGPFKELSMDSFGVMHIGFFVVIYLGLSLAQGIAILKRSNASTKHPLRIMLTVCILSAMVAIHVALINTCWFIYRGEDHPTLYLVAKTLKASSKYTLLCICLLVSRGHCISSSLALQHVWHAARLLLPIFLANLILEMWGEYAQSRKYTTDSIYCTSVGGIIILTDLGLLLSYLCNIQSSLKKESDPSKCKFYRTWGRAYSAAFLCLPFSVLVSQAVAPWVRARTTFVVSNLAHAALLTLLVIGLWPEKTQSFFSIDDQKTPAQTLGIQAELLQVASSQELEQQSEEQRW